MNTSIYNINLLILKHSKDKLRENVYWILQLRDVRSDGGRFEHSNKFWVSQKAGFY